MSGSARIANRKTNFMKTTHRIKGPATLAGLNSARLVRRFIRIGCAKTSRWHGSMVAVWLLAALMPAVSQIQPVWTRNDTSGFAAGLAVDGQSNLCVLAGSSGDFVTLKYSPNGALLWTNHYDSSLQDVPSAIAVDAAGQVWVTGTSSTNGLPGNIVTVKYGAVGAQLWARVSEETNVAAGYVALTLDTTGNSYVGGSSTSDGSSLVAIKY